MGDIGHNRRMKFVEAKSRQAFGKRNMDPDEMFADLVREGRTLNIH